MKAILLAILKILGFVLILPLIVASVIAFQTEILSLPVNKEVWLLWGAGIYVALNLFVYDFKNVYAFGNAQIDKVITFFKPAGYLVPLYSILLIIANIIVWLLGRGAAWQPYFLFALAFTLSMHVILTAHEIYESDKSLLKAHYLFSFGVLLVVDFFIISLLLSGVVTEYSFLGFVKLLASKTFHLYHTVYRTLFVDS